MTNQPPAFRTWTTHRDALDRLTKCGALQQVESALRRAYDLTEGSPKRLRPSSVVERELRAAEWAKAYVWAPDGLARGASDSFDGWKVFSDSADTRFGVAVEVEWRWESVKSDLLKFWRGQRSGQIAVGIVVLRGPDSFEYVVEHVYALYRELIPDLRVIFCALDATDLREPFPQKGKRRTYRMP